MDLGKIKTGPSYKKIAIVFIIIGIALFGVICYFSFSKAEITIYPKEENIKVDFETIICKNPDLITDEGISGEIVSKTLKQTKKITQVSEKGIEDRAQGTVTIYNNRSEQQAIIKGSRLWPNGNPRPQFRTRRWVSIPAHGKVQVDVTSDEKGKIGEIGPTKFIFPGFTSELYRREVYAESSSPMTGGYKEISVVTQDDIDKAKNNLVSELYEKVTGQLEEEMPEDQVLILEGAKKEVLNFSSTSEAGQENINEFEITAEVKVTTLKFARQELLELASQKLKNEVSQGKELQSTDEQTLKYTLKGIDLGKAQATVDTYLEGTMSLKLTSKIFDKARLIGLNEKELKDYFGQFDDIEKIEIKFTPSWIRAVPSLYDHVEISIK